MEKLENLETPVLPAGPAPAGTFSWPEAIAIEVAQAAHGHGSGRGDSAR
jgi:hypothetical protein